jgi:hypothetical protein
MSKVILLLTGAVNPNNMTFTKLSDARSRAVQYIESIRFWLRTANIPVVFVENSNVDFSGWFEKEIQENRLEMLHFDGNNFDRSLGKGYGELLCLEYAQQHSIYMRDADFVFKVTGRHKILNFPVFLKMAQQLPDIGLMVDFQKYMTFCDSRFFGYVPSFVPAYLSCFRNVLDDSRQVYFEHVFCMAALRAISDGYIFRPFVDFPRVDGVSGTSNTKYNSSYLYWCRMKPRYLLKSNFMR